MKLLLCVVPWMLLFGCTPPNDANTMAGSSQEAREIVIRSIEKHGGRTSWENLRSVAYNKITILFDSNGTEESRTLQRHMYILKPDLTATIQWIEKEDSIKISYNKGTALRYINGIPESNSEGTSQSAVDAAMYVLFQPFKLMDAGTVLEYVGVDTLDDKVVKVVKPNYAGTQSGDDEWFFYFDIATDELIANMVNHKGRRSLIKNVAFDPTIPLYLHQHRKSYFVDSLLNIHYIRAEYFYTDYKLYFVGQKNP